MVTQVNTMSVALPPCLQPEPLLTFPGGLHMGTRTLKFQPPKEKVIIVMGATGTGKSRLAIDLATHFPGEIINSDKIQLYSGLDIVTNKVTPEECRGIPHHLLGTVDPNADFTAADFCRHARLSIGSIIEKDKIPIIAGGSNSLIKTLVNDDPHFRRRYECCFIWVDVSLSNLRCFVSHRVDKMVEAGLVDEVRGLFGPKADFTKGIRRAIGVPEMEEFLQAERDNVDEETLTELLNEAIEQIKDNTYKLACKQLHKIHRLRDFWGWDLNRINATEVLKKQGSEANEAWEEMVVGPSMVIVDHFLNRVEPKFHVAMR
ncbi:uncharacterized protein [Phyllobates terribilis]|uniref:uncharacterized protein n=1 Tax=Phyllobates terribilis TaxID=111132 RepID=UPI003CCB4040